VGGWGYPGRFPPVGRAQLNEQILDAKRQLGLSWAAIADGIGRDRVWTVAACMGQHPFDADTAGRLLALLEIDEPGAVARLGEVPNRGALDAVPPTDPTIYRLYEVLQVYGPALKALIHEDFGDGIMSAINFSLDLERVERDGEPRVRITLDGKFLPYQW
jgi:cyanate lyase